MQIVNQLELESGLIRVKRREKGNREKMGRCIKINVVSSDKKQKKHMAVAAGRMHSHSLTISSFSVAGMYVLILELF